MDVGGLGRSGAPPVACPALDGMDRHRGPGPTWAYVHRVGLRGPLLVGWTVAGKPDRLEAP